MNIAQPILIILNRGSWPFFGGTKGGGTREQAEQAEVGVKTDEGNKDYVGIYRLGRQNPNQPRKFVVIGS
jgi:hypothetical protein